MKYYTSTGNVRRSGIEGFFGPQTRISDDSIVMRNAAMHRQRNSRLTDDQLLAKRKKMEDYMIKGALMELIEEEIVRRGL